MAIWLVITGLGHTLSSENPVQAVPFSGIYSALLGEDLFFFFFIISFFNTVGIFDLHIEILSASENCILLYPWWLFSFNGLLLIFGNIYNDFYFFPKMFMCHIHFVPLSFSQLFLCFPLTHIGCSINSPEGKKQWKQRKGGRERWEEGPGLRACLQVYPTPLGFNFLIISVFTMSS